MRARSALSEAGQRNVKTGSARTEKSGRNRQANSEEGSGRQGRQAQEVEASGPACPPVFAVAQRAIARAQTGAVVGKATVRQSEPHAPDEQ